MDIYRKDNRTDEQFAKEILERTLAERQIIERYADHLRKKYQMEVVIEDNGIDNSGAVLDEATTDADFLLNGKPIEVKYTTNHADEFRFKVEQIESYIAQGAVILMVNGWLTEEPLFTLIKTEKMKELTRTRMPHRFPSWGNKRCYLIKSYLFKWFSFI